MELFPYFERIGIPEKTTSSNMEKVNRSIETGGRDAVVDPEKKKHGQGNARKEQGDEAREHFESLKASADLMNRELKLKKLPYRFYIYRERDDIFYNLVRLDDSGSIIEIKRKNITHQEFADLIRHLDKGEGLFYESIG